MKQQNQLTEQESAFAAEYHNLIYIYLKDNELPEDEYYDIVLFGFLNGIRKYFQIVDSSQVDFKTLVRRKMYYSYINYVTIEQSLQDIAKVQSIYELYDEANFIEEMVSDTRGDNDTYSLEETISDAKDYAEKTIETLSIKETLQSFEQAEYEILKLLIEGYPKAEIRRTLGLTVEALNEAIISMQNKTIDSPLMQGTDLSIPKTDIRLRW